MENRIREIGARTVRLDPAEAEVLVDIYPEYLTSTTAGSGRLMGPRCPYSSTVEVAYALREVSRQYEAEGPAHIGMRVVVPEPCLWDPQSPFIYEASVELSQSGQRCDEHRLRHALCRMRLVPKGLRVNATLVPLRGTARTELTEAEARSLHDTRLNTIVVPVTEATAHLWEIADRFGLLVIGRLADEKGFSLLKDLRRHVSCAGWLLEPMFWKDPVKAAVVPELLKHQGQMAGLAISGSAPGAPVKGFDFLAGSMQDLSGMRQTGLPVLVMGGNDRHSLLDELPSEPGILGWIDK